MGLKLLKAPKALIALKTLKTPKPRNCCGALA